VTNSSVLILGMGNKLFGDDGVGIVIAEKLKGLLSDRKSVTVKTTNWGGFRVIDLLSGFDRAIIIDAFQTNSQPPGCISKYDYNEIIHSVRMISFHDINFATAVEFAKQMDIPMPESITIYGIEIINTNEFSEELTKEVEASVDKCVPIIMNELDTLIMTENQLLG